MLLKNLLNFTDPDKLDLYFLSKMNFFNFTKWKKLFLTLIMIQ